MTKLRRLMTGEVREDRDPQRPAKPGSGKRKETQLELPTGEPDLDALRSVTREWLVPRLVEKFLRMHRVELRYSQTSVNPTSRRSTPVVGSDASAGSPTQDSETLMNTKRPIRGPK
jgi:hypothetical protein